MGLLYARDGKMYCNDYMEIYIPKEYFEADMASSQGDGIESFGVVFLRGYSNGIAGKFNIMNVPVIVNFKVYEHRDETIKIRGRQIDVMTLQYAKDQYVMRQSVTKGREVGEFFLSWELGGKLPKVLTYDSIINIWWKNMEMAGVNYKVPSKMYEMIIATTYRDPDNMKRRYGQKYGAQSNPTGLDYAKSNVRNVVKDLSTFSGMVFEDMGTMISNGINNNINGIDERKSPLEKIIYY